MPNKTIIGTVTSIKMNKTITVSVDIPKRHKIYMKTITFTKKFKARDEMDVKLGDVVKIEECSPFSKTVAWKVIENLTKEEQK